jgi:hypothetical protein
MAMTAGGTGALGASVGGAPSEPVWSGAEAAGADARVAGGADAGGWEVVGACEPAGLGADPASVADGARDVGGALDATGDDSED